MDPANLVSRLQAAMPGAAFEPLAAVDQPTVLVPAPRLVETCRMLRDDPDLAFTLLADLTAVDWWPAEPRFEVVYHLASPSRRERLRLKTRVAGSDPAVPTVSGVWLAADWLEREVWDLVGVGFDGHPDLRRLIMPDDWEGHPLRKDYPVQIKLVPRVSAPLQLTEEEFRANLEADRRTRGGSG